MAKKQRVLIKNSRPRHNFDTDIISNTAQQGSSSASGTNDDSCTDPGSTGGGTSEINSIVKHSIHEVGQNGSSFPGTDTYGNPVEGATFADREKLYHRYDLLEGLAENGLVDEEGFPVNDSDVTARQYVYDQPTKERRSSTGPQNLIRKEEDSTALLSTHDEEYFQHLFSWPTNHTLRSRKVGGFI